MRSKTFFEEKQFLTNTFCNFSSIFTITSTATAVYRGSKV